MLSHLLSLLLYPACRRKSILRRTQGELTLTFAFHLIVMCLYICIHVYDATVFKRTGGKGFEGAETYGGRWKYLTYINLVSGRKQVQFMKSNAGHAIVV